MSFKPFKFPLGTDIKYVEATPTYIHHCYQCGHGFHSVGSDWPVCPNCGPEFKAAVGVDPSHPTQAPMSQYKNIIECTCGCKYVATAGPSMCPMCGAMAITNPTLSVEDHTHHGLVSQGMTTAPYDDPPLWAKELLSKIDEQKLKTYKISIDAYKNALYDDYGAEKKYDIEKLLKHELMQPHLPVRLVFRMGEHGSFEALASSGFAQPVEWHPVMALVFTNGAHDAAQYFADTMGGFVVNPFDQDCPVEGFWEDWLGEVKAHPGVYQNVRFKIV